jgi:8-oxo-dGTP pyrophosphatase MutT (NUDIX family)
VTGRVVHREVSRILLVDEQDRILLMLTDFPRHAVPALRWITPGGGVERGETHAEGAIRELFEETGLEIADPGAPVHSADTEAALADGTLQRSHSVFHLVRTTAFTPVDTHWTDDERVDIRAARWWTLAELEATEEEIAPADLVEIVRTVLVR